MAACSSARDDSAAFFLPSSSPRRTAAIFSSCSDFKRSSIFLNSPSKRGISASTAAAFIPIPPSEKSRAKISRVSLLSRISFRRATKIVSRRILPSGTTNLICAFSITSLAIFLKSIGIDSDPKGEPSALLITLCLICSISR